MCERDPGLMVALELGKRVLCGTEPCYSSHDSAKHVRWPMHAQVQARIQVHYEHRGGEHERPAPLTSLVKHPSTCEINGNTRDRVPTGEGRPLILAAVRPELRSRPVEDILQDRIQDEAADDSDHQMKREIAAS